MKVKLTGDSSSVETVRMGVRQSRLDELGATADQLTVYHRNEATGEWDELETTVVREGGTVTVLEAPSAGFSEYAIFAGDSPEPTETPTATPSEQPDTTATPTPIQETGKAQSGTPVPSESERAVTTTSGSGPGFTAIGALIAVLVVALVARRRT